MDTKQQALVVGAIRLGVGAALVAAPGWAGRIWVGPGADGPGSKVFARAVGARDVALGLRILQSAANDDSPGPWLRAGFVADIADAAATALASRNLSTARKVLMPLIAGGVGALGLAATKAAAWRGRSRTRRRRRPSRRPPGLARRRDAPLAVPARCRRRSAS